MNLTEIDTITSTTNVTTRGAFGSVRTGNIIEGGWIPADESHPGEFPLNGKRISVIVAGHRPSITGSHTPGWLVLIHTVDGYKMDVPMYEVWSQRDFDGTDGEISTSDLAELIAKGHVAAEMDADRRSESARKACIKSLAAERRDPVGSLGSLLSA